MGPYQTTPLRSSMTLFLKITVPVRIGTDCNFRTIFDIRIHMNMLYGFMIIVKSLTESA